MDNSACNYQNETDLYQTNMINGYTIYTGKVSKNTEESSRIPLGEWPTSHDSKRNGESATVTDVDIAEPVTLSWRDLNAYVTAPSRACCRGSDSAAKPKHILRNVTGHVKPGTLIAVTGSSGAGKSTLMNILACRNQGQLSTNGDIRVNGVDVGNGIRNISAYVQQDDLFIGTLTVREHLEFRALLRMDKSIKRRDRLRRVEEVIRELGLLKCADTRIGTTGKTQGISGGERKRLSFASEILTNPPLIFCDEPTSGLDSFMAANIVQSLKLMATKGRTILCTIHQPSSEVFDMFDELLILAEGRVAFMGHSTDALNFYTQVGYQCPNNYNPSDFYILTMSISPGQEEKDKRKVEEICDSFENSTYKHAINKNIDSCVKDSQSGYVVQEALNYSSRYGASWFQQFRTVFWRSVVTNNRDPMVLKAKVVSTIVVGILFGLMYLKSEKRLRYNLNDVQNVSGLLFLILLQNSFSNIMAVSTVFPLELPIFFREYGSGLYRVDVYYLCKSLAEIPQFIVFPFIMVSIIYYMADFYHDVRAFLYFAGVVLYVANIAASFGYIISAAVVSVSMATALAPPLVSPIIMFGGFLLSNNTIPDWLIWMKYLSWFQWSNELVTVNQWQNVGDIYCIKNINNTQPVCTTGDDVLENFDFSHSNETLDFTILTTLFVSFRIVSFIIILIRARRSSA